MRRCGKTPEFVVQDGIFYGLNLPADFVAEHEWGVEKLKQEFGIPHKLKPTEGPFGLERRRATKCPAQEDVIIEHHGRNWIQKRKSFYYERRKNEAILTVGWTIYPQEGRSTSIFDHIPRELKGYDDENISGAWDGESFGVWVKGEEQIQLLELFKKAIEECNILLLRTSDSALPVFNNPGLTLLLASNYPADAAVQMTEDDEENRKLYQAAEDTGIVAKLAAAGKRYYALRPHWNNYFQSPRETTHPVIYFLNPQEQQNNNFGWFSVEQLEQWIDGKGPIPKTEEQKKKR